VPSILCVFKSPRILCPRQKFQSDIGIFGGGSCLYSRISCGGRVFNGCHSQHSRQEVPFLFIQRWIQLGLLRLYGAVREWLKYLKLDEYDVSFIDNGYDEMETVNLIEKEDLGAIGVMSRDHQDFFGIREDTERKRCS
jgi:hypothetical protein